MYNISTEKDKPDIGYMEAKVDQLMRRGIRLADCTKLSKYYTDLREALKSDFITKYGIQNPNSSVQLTRYLEALSNQVDLKSKNDIINICFDDEKGKWTSNGDAMEKLADLGYEFAQDLLDYRHAKKYAESMTESASTEETSESGESGSETESSTAEGKPEEPGLVETTVETKGAEKSTEAADSTKAETKEETKTTIEGPAGGETKAPETSNANEPGAQLSPEPGI